jgi:CDP-glucose 4,6-dehydratase
MDLNAVFSAAYRNRRVLITGHTGFKGAWLGLWLKNLGAEAFGLSLDPPSAPSMYAALGLKGHIRESRTDITDYPALLKAIQDFAPEAVIHLAALALVRPSYKEPLATFAANVMGTANLLEACRRTGSVRAVVIVTSDKCYRNSEWVWGYRENDPLGGHDPYSASKGCAELLVSAYADSFFPAARYGLDHKVAVASARAGNAIGGGDWGADRLAPDCFRALHDGLAIQVRSPAAVRPWQHALECLSGYLLLGARLLEDGPRFNGGWNFAPADQGGLWPVERVVRRICELWGDGRYVVADSGSQPHEAHMLRLDCAKARIELGWRPRWPIARALEATTRWYKEWSADPDPGHMLAVTLGQIQDYAASPYIEG